MNPVRRERVFAAFTMPGESGAEVSRGMGITPQALSACFKEAVKEFPELKPCLPVNQQAKKPVKENDDLLTVDMPPPLPDYDAGEFED